MSREQKARANDVGATWGALLAWIIFPRSGE